MLANEQAKQISRSGKYSHVVVLLVPVYELPEKIVSRVFQVLMCVKIMCRNTRFLPEECD